MPAPARSRRRAYAEPPPGTCYEELISGKRLAAETAAASAAAQAAVQAAVQAAEDEAESPDEGSDFDDEGLWESGRRRKRARAAGDKAPGSSAGATRSSSSSVTCQVAVSPMSKVDELAPAVLGKEKLAQTEKFGLTKTIREIVA